MSSLRADLEGENNVRTRIVDNVHNHHSYGSRLSLTGSTGSSEMDEDQAPLIHSPMIWRLTRSMSHHRGRYDSSSAADARRTLGTFSGVFCPIALSMFSTLLLLRSGINLKTEVIASTCSLFVFRYGTV